MDKNKWRRETHDISAKIKKEALKGSPIDWCNERAQADDFILAHALDGVIWGYYDGNRQPQTAKTSPPLRDTTLQQIRIFNAQRELYLWRVGDTWHTRTITDGTGEEEYNTFDEAHIVLGTTNHAPDERGFTQMVQGAEGLVHAVPLSIEADTIHPEQQPNTRLGLVVRHYLHADPRTAMTQIIASRLVNLEIVSHD